MLKKTVLSAICAIAAAICTSCSGMFSGPHFHEVSFFDLGYPRVLPALPYDLRIRAFTASSATRYKMVFRRENRLQQHEYTQWSRTPAEMLTTYCRIALNSSAAQKKAGSMPVYCLSGDVLAFETDLGQNVCRMYVQCTVTPASDSAGAVFSKLYMIQVPVTISALKEPGPDAAVAMNQAAAKFMQELYQDLKQRIVQPAPAPGKSPVVVKPVLQKK